MGRDSADRPPRGGGESLVACYRAMWEGSAEPDVFRFLDEHPRAATDERLAVILHDLERCHELGAPRRIEEYFQRVPGIGTEHKLAVIEHEFRLRSAPDVDEFIEQFPEFSREKLRQRLLESEPTLDGPYSSEEWRRALGTEGRSDEMYVVSGDGGGWAASTPFALPERIGKLRIKRLLKVTGFKEVYTAHHDGLDLEVVVKRARPGVGLILDEARILARMDHPGIVKVFDADQEPDGRGYLVEQLIDGTDLAEKIAEQRPSHLESASLIAAVAEALQHVHTEGVFHRDIKPANILIDRRGRPVVTDFGLALRVEDLGDEGKQGGTVIYMSPEQARGEGHLVDGRTDIYSLGIVLYELLTGVRTVDGSSVSEVLERIKTVDIRPPRQTDPSIPEELERICLKASSKRATERYNTALDMAADLRRFLEERTARQPELDVEPRGQAARVSVPEILHKGLRAFEKEDADFFLELLPGPRDGEGLPESIRFWKIRIEATDPDRTFRVGLIYGPSGCGKSSLVKAGLLPRLDGRMVSVLLEATPENTETSLLWRLRREFPSLDPDLDLREALAEVRRGAVAPTGTKVLIVIDQFEQWLHGDISIETRLLTQALRHCDGEHLQCLLLVRDDFWMAITRFMRELEIPLQEGRNSAVVDLFDLRHARKVLKAFGRAYDRLPPADAESTRDQRRFLDTALAGLAENSRVIPVRLALFAEMLKSRVWIPRTLREIGGTLGVGVQFLEETFSAPHAPPEHRVHQKAAREVLRALLPDAGTNIKGHMRPRSELLQASGYAARPRDFEELLRILDVEVRLLTPFDPELAGAIDSCREGDPCYQLAHDYLVPPLREWLTRKQKETRRGRAALTLAEYSDLWNARPDRNHLPSFGEWVSVCALAPRATRTGPQRKMLRRATRFHLTRLAILLVVVLGVWGGRDAWNGWRVNGHVGAARAAWERGTEAWPTACGSLSSAIQIDPRHSAPKKLIREISTRGSLRVKALGVPYGVDVKFRVEADLRESAKLSLPSVPRLLSGGPVVENGGQVRLALGHYTVTPELDGKARPELSIPVCITQVLYREGANGWERVRRLPPQEISSQDVTEESDGSTSVRFGEHLVLDSIVFPESVPEGERFVSSGPFFRAETDFSSPIQELGDPSDPERAGETVDVFPRYQLVEDELESSFLMAENPTTVGEFEEWFSECGAAYCQWMVEDDPVLQERSTVRKVKAGVRYVPLDLQIRYWAPRLPDAVDVDKIETSDELMEIVFADELERAREKWDRYRKRIRELLAKEKVKTRPVGEIDYGLAQAYARTCRPIVCGELRSWLKEAIAEAEESGRRLAEVKSQLEAQSGDPEAWKLIPDHLELRHVRGLGPPRALFHHYILDLYYHVYYASQIPAEQVLTWARSEDSSLDKNIRSRLAEVARGYGKPHQWIYELAQEDGTPLFMPPVVLYARQLRTRTIHLPHFTAWLGVKLLHLREQTGRLSGWLRELDGLPESDVVREVAWELRLEYGWRLGYDLPDARQWEKALRGADDRRYPWGKGLDETVLGGRDGPESLDRVEVRDVSPYGVKRMGGQVSEWVRSTFGVEQGHYAKGGNYRFHPRHSDGGYVISVQPGKAWKWTGIRVIREIGKPPDRALED